MAHHAVCGVVSAERCYLGIAVKTVQQSGNSLWTVISDMTQYLGSLNKGTQAKIAAFRTMIEKFADKAETTNAYVLGQQIVKESGMLAEIYSDTTPEGIARQENLQEFLSALQDFVDSRMEEDRGNETYLSDYLQEVALLTDLDSDDKETRAGVITDFKDNFKVGILIVFNMLLTGFDAPRLKRLYFGRKLSDHNLLQAITRVNRPYGDNRYGYIIDFADIKKNFDETNAAYLAELNKFNDPDEVGEGNQNDIMKQVMEDPAELIKRMQEARQVLFDYPMDNAEAFSSEISTIEDKQVLLELRKALIEVRDCCNIVKTFGSDELKAAFADFDIAKIKDILSEVQRHINIINQREAIEQGDTTRILVNEAMNDITFNFSKIGEEELRMISGGAELNEKLQRTIQRFTDNIDPEDPEYITLREAFHQRFKEHGFTPSNMDEYNAYSKAMDEILKKLAELQKKNNALLRRYNGDAKFARVHKRIREENSARKHAVKPVILSEYDDAIVHALTTIKGTIDQKVYDRNDILKKDAYFEQTVMTEITAGMKVLGLANSREDRVFIQSRIAKHYLAQYNEYYPVA